MRKLTTLILLTLLPHIAVSQHVFPEDKAEAAKMYRYAYRIDEGAGHAPGVPTSGFEQVGKLYLASLIDSVANHDVFEAVYGPSLPYDTSPVRLFFDKDDYITKVIRIGSVDKDSSLTLNFDGILDLASIQKVTSIARDPTYSYQVYSCGAKETDPDIVVCKYDDTMASVTRLYDNRTIIEVYPGS